jgi:hypothetical protein
MGPRRPLTGRTFSDGLVTNITQVPTWCRLYLNHYPAAAPTLVTLRRVDPRVTDLWLISGYRVTSL